MSSITTSGLKSFTLASALAIATTLGFSAVANAASWSPWTFFWSPWFKPNIYYRGDCTIMVGVVWDYEAAFEVGNLWGVIGGTQVNCLHYHSMSVTVREVYSERDPRVDPRYAYFVGSPGTFYSSSTRGFDSLILQTSRICGKGYWYTQADVTISGVGTFSLPSNAYDTRTPRTFC